jgi:Nif-specific regulatory protein
VVLCEGGIIDADDLPLVVRRRPSTGGLPGSFGPRLGDPDVPLADIEQAHVEAVLAACDGNQSEAARRLGIGRNTLARKLGG